jgi:hypothetical protein
MKIRTSLLMIASTACGTPSPSAPDAATDAAVDAQGDADAGLTILPYPPGPYGAAIGDTMPDFFVVGYPLSRTQRDFTQLPFRDVALSELRSDPSCSCLVVMWNASGWSCPWCVMQDITFSSSMVDDPGLCAVEVLAFDYDSKNGAPPSRADLDDWVGANRESYAVGLPTPSLYQPMSVGVQVAIPDSFVLRTSDMRFVGYLPGVGYNIGQEARTLCDAPHSPVETLASGLAPTVLRIDDTDAYMLDDGDGLIRVPLAGGAKEILVSASSAPSAFALDAANVYFAATTGNGFAIEQLSKSGGPPISLDASSSAFTSIAVDSGFVFATRADGVIERVAIGGGSVQTLITGESDPGALALDDEAVFFIARGTNEIAAVPKSGGQRVSVAPSGALQGEGATFLPIALEMGLGQLLVATTVAPWSLPKPDIKAGGVFALRSGVPPTQLVSGPESPAVASTPLGVLAGLACSTGDFCVGRPQGVIDILGENQRTLSPGQPWVNAVAGDATYAYWTVGESAQGARDGALRRFKP